ncbi:hypothetical protein A3L09_00095 [Thermococcus profundus]|uniref:Uncharacterized protein n=1 Tax=Thermococcus profundus TaxID=49899 RepID=A0A2Z2M8U4_THEPR|nr:TasA family protein [Thermococcus profundus]ASJ01773.1 hypothetical protein A3L09_00095 [Thermococcus profundus]
MRSVALAFILVGLVFAGMGYGTWAVYRDTETSSGNSIQLGTLDLVLTDGVPDADGQWVITNAVPGSTATGDIRIINNGSVEADHVEIGLELVCWEDDDGNLENGQEFGPRPDEVDGVGNLPEEIKVTTQYYAAWTGERRQLDNNADIGDIVETLYLNLPAPPAVNGDVNDAIWNQKYGQFDMNLQIVDTGTDQNYWQGDVCEIIVHVALAQAPGQQVFTEPFGFTEHPANELPT